MIAELGGGTFEQLEFIIHTIARQVASNPDREAVSVQIITPGDPGLIASLTVYYARFSSELYVHRFAGSIVEAP